MENIQPIMEPLGMTQHGNNPVLKEKDTKALLTTGASKTNSINNIQ